MVGKGHKITKCFFRQRDWAQKTLFCFFGQCINNEIKQILTFYHFFLML